MRREKVSIKRLGINGEGIGYINKKICFIPQALVGDEVEVVIDREEKRYMNAHIIKFYKKSSQRIKSPCRESRNCQGCAFMHMRYEDQLVFKRDLIKETLSKYTELDVDHLDIKPVIGAENPLGYRHEVRFPIGYYKGKLAIGVYQRGSRYFTFMNHCFLQADHINETLVSIENILNEKKCRDYNDKVQRGLRFLIVREIEGKLDIVFVTGTDGIKQEVTEAIGKLPNVANVYYTINVAKYQEFEEKGYKRIHGSHNLSYHINDHEYELSIKSEILDNPEMEAKRKDIIADMIAKDDLVLSLYATNGILESELENDIIAISEDAWHVEDASKNARKNAMANKIFVKGKSEEEIVFQSKKNDINTLLIHLGKEQLDDEITESLMRSLIPNVVIISDNTAAIARCINDLSKRYKLDDYKALDAEPYTARVQSIIKLVRK